MKYRYYNDLKDDTVPGVSVNGDPVKGRQLVATQDGIGFSVYEIRPKIGEKLTLLPPEKNSPEAPGSNHIYYFLDGHGSASTDTGESYRTEVNSMLALPPAVRAQFTATDEASRMAVVHAPSSSTDPSQPRPLFRSVAEIQGTERDVDWHRGRSRRFIVKNDGYNLSIHNTTCWPGHSSPLWYRHNYEIGYYIRGDVMYDWDGGQTETSLKQKSVSDGDGLMMIMDKNDQHTIHARSEECECLCIFYPPLKGTETHDFTKGGFSAY